MPHTNASAGKLHDSRPDTRQRLIAAMSDALRRRGYHGIGLNELLAAAGAPKGVLYHHFPGGKTSLAVAAIEASVARIAASLDELIARGDPPLAALGAWLDGACRGLEKTRFESGCPLAAVALESTPEDAEIRAALAAGFAQIRRRIAMLFAAHGESPERAEALAALIVSAYEGGLMQSRVAETAEPMTQVGAALRLLLGEPDPGRAAAAATRDEGDPHDG
jgi:TetR/AcrR family transcriptional regulator, lmrAB and yxaGH operons repressor